jgi:hypothetical protein
METIPILVAPLEYPLNCEGEYDSREDALRAKIADEIAQKAPTDKINTLVA